MDGAETIHCFQCHKSVRSGRVHGYWRVQRLVPEYSSVGAQDVVFCSERCIGECFAPYAVYSDESDGDDAADEEDVTHGGA